jgi:protein-S-isoprenylcysteine O-methyltransferase Ste14
LPINSYITLIFAWLTFGVLHSVLAYQPFKNRLEKQLKAKYKYYRLVYSIFATINLALVVWYHISITKQWLWQPPLLQKIIASLLVVIGSSLMLLCMKKYFADLSGIDALTGNQAKLHLEITGIHALVRHPLYTVTILFVWSLFLWQPLASNAVSCMCITLYTRIGIYFEEKKLIQLFGKDYQLYQVGVPMLIPKLF